MKFYFIAIIGLLGLLLSCSSSKSDLLPATLVIVGYYSPEDTSKSYVVQVRNVGNDPAFNAVYYSKFYADGALYDSVKIDVNDGLPIFGGEDVFSMVQVKSVQAENFEFHDSLSWKNNQ